MVPHPPADLTEAGDDGPNTEIPESTIEGTGARTGRPSRRPTPVEPGQTLGRYVLLGRVGRGGMGTVLKAYDGALDRAIALKLLHSGAAERHAKRLTREAQALAKLSHPNVVHVYEVGQADGQWYLAMELVHGQPLRQWQKGSRPWRELVEVYRHAGEGLRAAHAAGLVHRDFKPDNCIIDEHGHPKVVDFGLVRETGTASRDDLPPSADMPVVDDQATAPLTREGAVLGTVAYMPLEQLGGQPVDARSDQFSFCVALYEALYGERPFKHGSTGELTAALVSGEVRPAPRGTSVPSRIRRILLRGLAADPDQRWPSMDALLSELRDATAPPRRGSWVLLAGGALALGIGLWPRSHSEPPCQGAATQLADAWDETRSAAVHDAILSTEVPYAEDTWSRIQPALDEYAEAWVRAHTDACEATSVRKEQSTEVLDLRMACLQRSRLELREAVGVLMEATPTRVQRATTLVSQLPPLSRCEDIEALRADHPPPEDPDVARRVGLLQERTASVRSLFRAGEYAIAMAQVEDIATEADALDHGPSRVEAIRLRGKLHEKQGDYAEAERDLQQAHFLAAELGLRRHEVDTAATLTFLIGGRRGDAERALWWGRLALAQATGLPNGIRARAHALNNLGTTHKNRGDLDLAMRHYQQALDLHESASEVDELDVARVLNNMAMVLREQRELEESLAMQQRVLSIRREVLGETHPMIASTLNNIGSVYRDLKDTDAALDHFQRALAIWEETLALPHPHVAGVLFNIAVLHIDRGDDEAAVASLRRVLPMFEQTLGPEHPRTAWVHTSLGSVLKRQRQLDEALGHLQRGRAILEQTRGPDHPDLAMALHYLAEVRILSGDTSPEVREMLQHSLSIREKSYEPDHPALGSSHLELARLDLLDGRPAAAREHAERAIAIWEATTGWPGQLALARGVLAEALWADPDQRPRARQLAEEALAQITAQLSADHPRRLAFETWIREHPWPPPP